MGLLLSAVVAVIGVFEVVDRVAIELPGNAQSGFCPVVVVFQICLASLDFRCQIILKIWIQIVKITQ